MNEEMLDEILDSVKALDTVEGDLVLFRTLVGLFVEEYPRSVQELESAIAADDVTRVEREAHRVKGAVGNFSAGPAWRAAYTLECTGKSKQLAEAPAQLLALRAELARLEAALHAICAA